MRIVRFLFQAKGLENTFELPSCGALARREATTVSPASSLWTRCTGEEAILECKPECPTIIHTECHDGGRTGFYLVRKIARFWQTLSHPTPSVRCFLKGFSMLLTTPAMFLQPSQKVVAQVFVRKLISAEFCYCSKQATQK